MDRGINATSLSYFGESSGNMQLIYDLIRGSVVLTIMPVTFYIVCLQWRGQLLSEAAGENTITPPETKGLQ